MINYVYINGRFMPAEEAKISVFDHGFLYGDGLFETMRAYDGVIFMLEAHLDRLEEGLRALEISIPYTRDQVIDALKQSVKRNGPDLHIRLTVSRGPGAVGIDPDLCTEPTLVIMTREARYNEALYTGGAKAVFVKTLRNLAGAALPEVKSLNFLNNILAKMEVKKACADEGFMLNHLGKVTEGTVSNVFLVSKGSLMTPHLNCGLLPGIVRGKVLELAEEMGFSSLETELTKGDFLKADEVFYTNSGAEIVPVTLLDRNLVGSGHPGPVTLKLLEKYRFLAGRKLV